MVEAADGSAATAPRLDEFKDPSTLLRCVIGLLIACSIASVVALVFRGLEYRLLLQIGSGELSGAALMPAAESSDRLVEGSSWLCAVIYLITCIPFGMWIYRANRNARALGAVGMKYSAGWAVGSYFVPIVNFFAPFLAMREIWRASANPGNPDAAPGTPLLGWWWTLWLANAISGTAASIMLKQAQGLDMVERASLLASSQNVFHIAVCLVALQLLRRISANQLGQARLVDVF